MFTLEVDGNFYLQGFQQPISFPKKAIAAANELVNPLVGFIKKKGEYTYSKLTLF